MAFFLILLLAVQQSRDQRLCPLVLGNLDVVQKYHFEPFSLPKHQRNLFPDRWKTQQGLIFVSADTVAIFQVEKRDGVSPLASRQPSGGSGSFVFHVEFLGTRNIGSTRSMYLTTSASDFSQVHPTHDGNFLVRTGEILRLYSPTLDEIASKPLPVRRTASNESWTVTVDSTGRRVHLEHYEYFGPNTPDRLEHIVLDADSLKPIEDMSAGVHSPIEEASSRNPNWDLPNASRKKNEEVASALENDSLLAVEMWRRRRNPLDLNLADKPLRIVVYDAKKHEERCSIPISTPVSGPFTGSQSSGCGAKLYSISSDGKIAVLQGNILSVYQP